VELAKPIGLRPLKPPYGMVNFIELHLTAQVEKIEDLGVKVDYVGTIISSFIKDEYVTMVF